MALSTLMKAALLLLISVANLCEARAQLRFDALERQAKAGLHDVTVSTEFRFTNIGSRAITIHKIVSECGCLVGKVEKMTYQPNESGLLRAEMQVAGKAPESRYTITLECDDAKQYAVTFVGLVPRSMDISPRLLIWNVGEAPKARFLDVTIESEGLRFTGFSPPAPPGFTIEVQKGPKPGKHRIKITPLSTRAALKAVIAPQLEGDQKLPQDLSVYLVVR